MNPEVKFHKALHVSRLHITDPYHYLSIGVIYDAFARRDIKFLTGDGPMLDYWCMAAGIDTQDLRNRAEVFFPSRS